MDKTIDVFSKELNSLRTGRDNENMLDTIKVDVYGQKMPVNQLATITTPEPRTINVQVWDLNNVNLIDSAIKKSDLGLNPQNPKTPKPLRSENNNNFEFRFTLELVQAHFIVLLRVANAEPPLIH